MNVNEQLGSAIRLASSIHEGVTDKSGKPYILHPLYVMTQLLYDTELAIMGVLHDVIEDSDLILEDFVRFGYSERVIKGLDCLTHREEETYEEYIDRICDNYDAIRVKRKDLEHNSNITRLKGVRPKDLERIEKYHKAFIKLGEARKKF